MPKKVDWTGYKYNTFTVLGLDEEKEKYYKQKILEGTIKKYNSSYLCQCECGKIVSICVTQIAKKKPMSCGCKPIRHGEDLTGKTFGNWTVLERDIQKEEELKRQGKFLHSYWKCKCACGQIVSVSGTHLKGGRTLSCGCKKTENFSKTKSLNLTGQKFGKLTCIKQTNKKSKNGFYWLCQCECGEQNVVPVYYLTSGKIKECDKCRANGFSSIQSYVMYKRTQLKAQQEESLEEKLKEKYSGIDINSIWSCNNIVSPKDITSKSHRTIYLICPQCKEEFTSSGLHLYNRTYEIMCPTCLRKIRDSSYEKEVKNYLNNILGIKTLHEAECNLKPINPKTGQRMYYDNELSEYKIIIEVHGAQHYCSDIIPKLWCGNVSQEEYFEKLKYRDNFKKNYALSNGYKYIALSYKEIVSGEYKNKINNLIREGENYET